MPRSFDDIYAHVPTDQRERLRAFRAAHPPRYRQIGQVQWEYLVGGTGKKTVLLLVGGLRAADGGFRMTEALEDEFRLIVPTYPVVPTMAHLCEGLAAILTAEDAAPVHLIAGSFGGMVAQAFVRAYPQYVDRMILSTTAVLDADAVRRYQQQLQMILPLPEADVLQGAKAQMLSTMAPPEAELALWTAYLDELYSERLGKDALVSTYHCIIDFAMSYHLQPTDLDGWHGQMLIIESDDDATFSEAQRTALKALYPRAQVHTFSGAGHSPGSTRRAEYTALVKQFFNIPK